MAFTFFFRDTHTLEHAAAVMIPEVAGRSRVRIWDAGCAMGPEPYTLAIILAEKMGNFAFKNVYITASDIDESGQFGEIIKQGIYTDEELGRIPEDIMAKYFSPVAENPGTYIISEGIRSKIKYQTHDLLTLSPVGDGFSMIICKNVLLHFEYAERIKVIEMFAEALAPGGLLVTEHTQKMPEELNNLFVQIVPDARVYRKTGTHV